MSCLVNDCGIFIADTLEIPVLHETIQPQTQHFYCIRKDTVVQFHCLSSRKYHASWASYCYVQIIQRTDDSN